MKILITGSEGQLGEELLQQLVSGNSVLGRIPKRFQRAEVLHPGPETVDICDWEALELLMARECPEIVFHCAALTNVDGCEDTPELTMRTNGESVGELARQCESIGSALVYLSSDYVFDGSTHYPYRETDRCAPRSVYGQSKLMGEEYALRLCSRSFVIRTAWLYGFRGNNFVKTILKKARTQDVIYVVNDQFGCPTNAEDLAYHILRIAATDAFGLYHCTGNGICSWYDFAVEIVRLAGYPCEVRPCTSQEYPQKAKRPAYSVLAHDRLRETVGDKMRDWKEALRDYIGRLGKE